MTTIDTEKLAPCGYCRRCAIHDDPCGCLEVEAYERELLAQGVTFDAMKAAVAADPSPGRWVPSTA